MVVYFKILINVSTVQYRTHSVRHSAHLANTLLKDEESAWDSHAVACNFAKYSPILIFFLTFRLSNKPFLIWLLTTPPHFKYAATLPCNLSLMACLADDVSQGSVATCASCDGIFDMHLTANLPRNLPVKKICKVVRIWQNYGHESVAPFFGLPSTCTVKPL